MSSHWKNGIDRISSRATDVCCLLLISGFAWARPAYGEQKKPLPIEVTLAKTIYVDNETGDKHLLDTAKDDFKTWGRFAIADSQTDANLLAVFTSKLGLDRFGNASFVVMDVYISGHSEPAFEATNAAKSIFAPEHRAKTCIDGFRKRLEPKH